MKVLLFYPPITMPKGDISDPSKSTLIGLGYIASMLIKYGYETIIIDGYGDIKKSYIDDNWTRVGLTDTEVKEKISKFQPDVVGISCMFTPYYRDALNIARITKLCNPKILIVIGGSHVSSFPETLMKDQNVDCAVVGEGEYTLIEILERFKKKQSLDGVKGILHRKNGIIIREEPREFIKDLDRLPFPTWFLSEGYEKVLKLNKDNPFLMRKPIAHMITSRGCPKNCSFCSVSLTWGTQWRGRSAKNVVDEVEFLVTKGFKEIHFVDDNLSVSKKRLTLICEEIINRKLDIKWAAPTGIGYWTLSPDILDLMKNSGCYRLIFGIESGSEDTLSVIGKGKQHNWEKLQSTINYANRIGLWTAATFIIGFPHETDEDFMKTLTRAKSLNLDYSIFYLLVPQPGTRIYNTYKEKKLLDFDRYLDPTYVGEDISQLSIVYSNGFANENFNLPELQDWLSKIYRSYFIYKAISPITYINLLRKIRSLEHAYYMWRMVKIGIKSLISAVFTKFNNQKIRNSKVELHSEIVDQNFKSSDFA